MAKLKGSYKNHCNAVDETFNDAIITSALNSLYLLNIKSQKVHTKDDELVKSITDG